MMYLVTPLTSTDPLVNYGVLKAHRGGFGASGFV